MPMKKDVQKGGTNADGSRSAEYCSLCFVDGAFTSPIDIDTPRKMQDFCMERMKEQGTNGILAWVFTRNIPRLKRWSG